MDMVIIIIIEGMLPLGEFKLKAASEGVINPGDVLGKWE